MSDLYTELVARVKAGMEAKGLTQVQVACRADVSQGNLSKILRGMRPCTTLATWDRLLGVVE